MHAGNHARFIAQNVDGVLAKMLAKEAPGQAFDESKHPRGVNNGK